VLTPGTGGSTCRATTLRRTRSTTEAGVTGRSGSVDADTAVETLVSAAASGDSDAWDVLVERFAGVVWAGCRRFRLKDADARDVSQTVWLRAVERLDTLRAPQAFVGWLVTTTRNECLRVLRVAQRVDVIDITGPFELPADPEQSAPDRHLLAAERELALQAAFADLPERHQKLMRLLMHDPPYAYVTIGEMLGIPVGSIGPTRARILARLRTHDAIQSLVDDASGEDAAGTPGVRAPEVSVRGGRPLAREVAG
jgi:RNA polymerase sigma factor (sigma-70 family)